MKIFARFCTITLLLVGVVLVPLNAQVDTKSLDEELLTTALTYEFNKDFDVVFDGVKQGLEDAGYDVDYASKRKKIVETKFQILAADDDFNEIMEQYGKVPYVRSPSWKNGRILVTVRIQENESGSVAITVQAELSAFEQRFLRTWVYWATNGIPEEEALSAIVAAVDAEEGSEL